jgi:hypothetical protein
VSLRNLLLDVGGSNGVDGEKFVRGLFCDDATARCQEPDLCALEVGKYPCMIWSRTSSSPD